MINASSELNFLYRGLRSLVKFRLQAAIAWVRHGHIVRRRAIESYLAAHPVRKLHLGASQELDGFLNSQVLGAVPIDITGRLPLPDRSFDLFYSSHLVEHIHRRQFLDFLTDCRRVLKPGGINIVATPSAEKIARTVYGPDGPDKDMLMEAGARFYPEDFHTPAHQLNLTMRAFGHRFLYDLEFMRKAGHAAGYEEVERVDNLSPPDPVLGDYIRAHKPPRWNIETETFVFRAPQ